MGNGWGRTNITHCKNNPLSQVSIKSVAKRHAPNQRVTGIPGVVHNLLPT